MEDMFNYKNKDNSKKEDKFEILSMDFLENSDPLPITQPVTEDKPKKKRKKKSTSTKTLADGTTIVTGDDDSDLSLIQSNQPYSKSYGETNNMLKSSVFQIDSNLSEIQNALKIVQTSKTLRKKYDYMAEFGSTMASLIGTKITAIREMNNSITHGHDLELKRMKELKVTESEKDDDKQIMDMYNAFISTPVGNYNPLNAPTMQEMTSNSPNINRIPMVTGNETGDMGYDNYINNMSPQQHMMTLEGNSNVKTVLRYNQNTGARCFDVIDMTTGQSIPNTDKPDQMIAEDCTVDLRNGLARNSNIGTSYELVVEGNNPISEY